MGLEMDKKVSINQSLCKGCGICVAICPKKILFINEDEVADCTDKNDCIACRQCEIVDDKASITNIDDCIGCRQCEYHCPDFAILMGEYNG